jgi:hypothetical protein
MMRWQKGKNPRDGVGDSEVANVVSELTVTVGVTSTTGTRCCSGSVCRRVNESASACEGRKGVADATGARPAPVHSMIAGSLTAVAAST